MQIHDQGDRVTYVLSDEEVAEAMLAFIKESRGEEAIPRRYAINWCPRRTQGQIVVEIMDNSLRQGKPR